MIKSKFCVRDRETAKLIIPYKIPTLLSLSKENMYPFIYIEIQIPKKPVTPLFNFPTKNHSPNSKKNLRPTSIFKKSP